ncbi:MAG: hypothetical protein A2252_01115 [Elusimicrobia bacterium RIFOXYA2_FULL_39_19]|nr:MAG: hypothetical protein A2252_01115 [Elusimicrobia bacterium RIFOXYA2_FULL_39_19]
MTFSYCPCPATFAAKSQLTAPLIHIFAKKVRNKSKNLRNICSARVRNKFIYRPHFVPHFITQLFGPVKARNITAE